jgi:4-hydroxy-tetrahydrodipicolinate synthase
MSVIFQGLGVALATPFTSSGAVDLPAFKRLVKHVVHGGVDFLVVLGSTGEAATLNDSERDALIVACRDIANGKPVVVGAGSSSTAQAANWCARAKYLGAQGALVVTPPYNKPTASGLVAHYQAVADAAPGLPIILYNIPGRTGQNLAPATLARLWDSPQIMAIKESSGNLGQIVEEISTLPPDKLLLAGDDNLALPTIAAGGKGLISVLGNLLPRETKALVDAALAGNFEEAQAHQTRLLPLINALFIESNPIPLKAGLKLLGMGGDMLRLPLTPPEASTCERIAEALCLAAEGTLPGLSL